MDKNLQKLIDKVIDQIQVDLNNQDQTCIEELLKHVSEVNLRAYLPQNVLDTLK